MKVITCFSYKGGAGRTVAAGNIAAALASSAACGAITKPLECKVALIDLDVFSAGTHRVFEIGNPEIQQLRLCVQDYLQHEIKVGDYLDAGGLTPDHEFMEKFKKRTHGCCLSNLTLLPAKPVPDRKFAPQKYHENQLLSLILELEQRDYHYVILDGENGMRAMADIALRLADVVLMFFRLTWQHIEGTLEAATSFSAKPHCPAFYLIPTCLPLVEAQHRVYQSGAPGLKELQDMTKEIPLVIS
jgi:cellulose biosynthesis protein BcsQ